MTEYEDSFETPSSSETTSQTSTRRSSRHETAALNTHEAATTHSEASATTPLPSVALAHERTTTTTTAMASRAVSQPMSHSSTEDTMSEERKRTALEAPSRAAFQQLSHFVAFGSGSAGTTPMTTPLDKPAQSTANATAKEGAHVQPSSFDEALVHTPTHVPTPAAIVSTQEPQRQGLLSAMMDDHTHTSNVTAGIKEEREEEDTTLASAEKSTRSLDQMSVISTLSQFMQKRQAAPTLHITAAPVTTTSESTPPIANEASYPVTNSTAPALLLPPSSALSTQVARTTATTTTTDAAQTTSNIAPGSSSKPTLMSALTQLRLPDLPPSSLASRQERPMPPLRLGEQPLIFTTDRGESQSSPNGDIPPLPSAPGTSAPATITTSNTNNNAADAVQASQARVHELQATTEAVERLVRAFALLRGYPAQPPQYEDTTTSAWMGKDGDGNKESATLYGGNDRTSGRLAVATLESANAYRPGAEATVRVNQAAAEQQQQQRRQAMRLRALARHVPQSATVQQNSLHDDPYVGMMNEVNEQLVEEVVLSCVTEMLAEAPRNKRRVTHKGDHTLANTMPLTDASSQPACELVTVEDFSAHGVSSSSLSRRRGWATAQSEKAGRTRRLDDAYVFAEDAMHAFAPDGGPDVPEALYQSLREALHKYVLRHVIGLTSSTVQYNIEDGTHGMPPITAFFAWALLIDLLSVCQDILASDALCDSSAISSSSGRHPVWVRYCGPPTQRMIAAAAMHCLPFEVLPTAASQNTNGNTAEATYAGRLFQLDYWVTRRAMWVIAAAITDTLRAHIVRCATVLDYDLSTLGGYPCLNGTTNNAVDPLCASLMPLFELVSSSTGDASASASPFKEENSSEEMHVAARTFRRHPYALRSSNVVPDKGDDAAYFGIHSDGLQTLTHAVSVLTTELMTHKENIPNNTVSGEKKEGQRAQPVQSTATTAADTMYSDLSRCACETLCELMQDEAIRAAVARHTQEKYNKLLQERQATREATKGLSKSEVQRRAEELRRLARAEKEVEQVVERIRQEMTVRPLTS